MSTPNIYYKVTNKKECHRGFQYKDGLNILQERFAEEGTCVPGGFYFTNKENIQQFLTYGIYIREVILPTDDPDFKMVQDNGGDIIKWRANRIILGKRYDIFHMDIIKEFPMIRPCDVVYACCRAGNLDLYKIYESDKTIQYENDLAMLWAAEAGQIAIIEHIGINPFRREINGQLFYSAIRNGHLELVKYLYSKVAYEITEINWKTAWDNGNYDVAEFLFKKMEQPDPSFALRFWFP